MTCATCHDVNDWAHAVFDHAAAAAGFALLGRHDQAPCTSCHVPPDNALKWVKPAGQDDCVACHRPEYDSEHSGTNFPLTCATCHTNTTWAGATFDHGTTSFPLEGAHLPLLCTSCHGPNNTLLFRKPAGPQDCVACHQAEFDREHAGSGFPTTCLSCHTSSTFSGATFDHGTTRFALVGAHVAAQCSACHGPNNVLKFPKPAHQDDCIACHQTEFTSEHGGSGYPVTCLTCHTTSTFTGATFDHDAQFFPIQSGKHRNEWNTCADCHPSPQDYSVFSCLSCHEHRRTAMDDKHKNMPGYGYASPTCLGCHPQGSK
jgi:hypothetical protein